MAGLEFSDMRGEAHEGSEAAEPAPTAPSDHQAAALEPCIRIVDAPGTRSAGDLAERPGSDAQAGGYGQHDEHAKSGTPHLDEAKELAGAGERYHAGGGGNLKHDGKVAAAAAASGMLLIAVMSGSGGPTMSAQETNTTQIAAAAEYPAGGASAQSAAQNLNIELIPPAADPKDNDAVAKDIQAAEAEGAANMHGGSAGVTPREYAVEAFATDKESGVTVPASAKDAMTAGTLTEQSGGDPGAEYMKAADGALGAADQASADGTTIKVPISEKK